MAVTRVKMKVYFRRGPGFFIIYYTALFLYSIGLFSEGDIDELQRALLRHVQWRLSNGSWQYFDEVYF